MTLPRGVRFGFVLVCILSSLFLACGGGSSANNGGGGNGGGGSVSVSGVAVSPKHAELVVSTQTQQFAATVTGDSQNRVTWSVDSVDGGNATVGTISATGLYTPPASGGTHTIKATSTVDNTKNASAAVAVSDLSGVLTYHNNLARDGTNVKEFALTSASVTSSNFGKLFSCPVDAAVYAQPLWVPNLNIGGQARNVIFVVTERDSLYALDADKSTCTQLWHVNLVDAAHGGTSNETFVPTSVICGSCTDIQPDIGVTGTPVIDPVSHTLYVVSKSINLSSTFFQRLHALDLTSGAEKFNGPMDISATVPGNGNGSVSGSLDFDPMLHNQRSALALANGTVYIPWAAHEDIDPYHGWVMAYNANTLTQTAVYNATPNATRGGIWMSGAGPAIDSTGNVYLSTGNGTFDADSTSNDDFGDTVVKLNSSALSVLDWFTPFDQSTLEVNDTDLAAGGLLLLPDQSSGPSHLLVATSKEGMLYLLNRDSMGNFCGVCVADTNTVQAFKATNAFFSTPAFWQNGLYLAGISDNLVRFSFTAGAGTPFNPNPTTQSSNTFGFPGATPSISSQGASNGIVWAIDSHDFGPPHATGPGPAILHAYDATNLATELWNSSQAAGNRDQAGNAVKFTVPTVANGKVYIGTRTEVDVYGLLP